MADTPNVRNAVSRLEGALDRLEAAVNRRNEAERRFRGLEEEVQRMNDDRSRLAQDLDGAEARSSRLEETNREVSRRLVAAMESIRTVLEAHGG